MKNLLHVTSFSLLILLITANLSFAQPSGVSVDEVLSLRGGAIAVDIPTTFKINFNNDYGLSIQGFSFAFRFYITNNGEMTTGVFAPVTNSIIDTDNWTAGFNAVPVYTEEQRRWMRVGDQGQPRHADGQSVQEAAQIAEQGQRGSVP